MVFLKKGASFKRFSTWYRLNDRPIGKLHSIKNPIVKILLHTFWSVALNEPSGLASTTKFLLSSPNKDLQETAFRKEIFRLRIKYVADNLDHICVKIVGKVTGKGHGKSSINLLFNLQNKVVLYRHNIKVSFLVEIWSVKQIFCYSDRNKYRANMLHYFSFFIMPKVQN